MNVSGGKRSATTGWCMTKYADPGGVAAPVTLETYIMSTYASLHYHITFGTKHRRPLIARSWESHLHEYLGGTVRGLDGFPQGVGGVEDHVHLLVGLKTTHTVADFLRELKWRYDPFGIGR